MFIRLVMRVSTLFLQSVNQSVSTTKKERKGGMKEVLFPYLPLFPLLSLVQFMFPSCLDVICCTDERILRLSQLPLLEYCSLIFFLHSVALSAFLQLVFITRDHQVMLSFQLI